MEYYVSVAVNYVIFAESEEEAKQMALQELEANGFEGEVISIEEG